MMIETIAVPILMKAVDFLFGEGHKICQERRERRKHELEKERQEPIQDDSTVQNVTDSSETINIQSKDEALAIPIDKATWNDSEKKVKHLLTLLAIYSKNYYHAKEQYAKWGDALVPSIIIHNLAEAEDQVENTTKELQTVLSEVYAKPIDILRY
jgi:hypothetical protein